MFFFNEYSVLINGTKYQQSILGFELLLNKSLTPTTMSMYGAGIRPLCLICLIFWICLIQKKERKTVFWRNY